MAFSDLISEFFAPLSQWWDEITLYGILGAVLAYVGKRYWRQIWSYIMFFGRLKQRFEELEKAVKTQPRRKCPSCGEPMSIIKTELAMNRITEIRFYKCESAKCGFEEKASYNYLNPT